MNALRTRSSQLSPGLHTIAGKLVAIFLLRSLLYTARTWHVVARGIGDSEAPNNATRTGARVRRPRAGPVSPRAAATAWRRFPRLAGAAGFRARAPLGDLTPRNGAAPTAAAAGRPRRRRAAGCAPRPRIQRAVRCRAARAPVSALGGARSVGRLSAPPPPPPPASAPNPSSARPPPA